MVEHSSLILLVSALKEDRVLIWDDRQSKVMIEEDINEPVLRLDYSNKVYTVGLKYQVQCYHVYQGHFTTI